ncbi:NUDIX hydrolase [Nonomuraea turcica]|uniref:NUDIX hydrolase n=1 Tax=Nonomuraea sp. G32 TaxID=3067274 RepID=UPI00273C0A65|nr:NUDIX domain-containing protein [Nonomuraea sp. G32]MDP4505752.1 NUDIX domain-containing protein [Nonomuraea sp. G32]
MAVAMREVQETLLAYLAAYPDELHGLEAAVRAILDRADITPRSHLQGHVTCSVAAINPSGLILEVHHRFLGLWLPPGGHLDPRDDSLLDAGLRELYEETGIRHTDTSPASAGPVEVVLGDVPARPSRGEPAHWHLDFAFAVHVDAAPMLRPDASEIHDIRWTPGRATTAGVRLSSRLAALLGHSDPGCVTVVGGAGAGGA